jgi:hypothetical protein
MEYRFLNKKLVDRNPKPNMFTLLPFLLHTYTPAKRASHTNAALVRNVVQFLNFERTYC